MSEEEIKLSWEEIHQIRMQLYDKLKEKYDELPPKKQYILEVIEDRGGSVSLQLLSKIMHYKIDLLENWILELHAERKIIVEGGYPNWILTKRNY